MLQDQINWQQWAWWESESTNPKSLPEEASVGRRTSSAFWRRIASNTVQNGETLFLQYNSLINSKYPCKTYPQLHPDGSPSSINYWGNVGWDIGLPATMRCASILSPILKATLPSK